MKHVVLAALSVALAIYTNITVQSLVEEDLKPVGEKCFAGDYEGIIPFEPYLGGAFVCIITTFFHDVVVVPEGLFAIGAIATIFYPFFVLLTVEASRTGVKGILKYPIVILVISQYIAISVAVPLIWVPFYLLWGRGTTQNFGTHHIWCVAMNALWVTGVAIMYFVLDTKTYTWTFVAGLLGGPFLHISQLGQWFLPSTIAARMDSSLVVNSYKGAMASSFTLWAFVVYSLVDSVGVDATALYGAIWENTNYAVKMLIVDAIVFFLALMFVVFADDPVESVRAVVLSPFIGPGAAVSYALMQEETRALKDKKVD